MLQRRSSSAEKPAQKPSSRPQKKAARPVDATGKTALVVLGMHRAGTSALAGTLVRLGAAKPKSIMPATEFNERGYYELTALMQLNDEVLASAGSAWDDWRAFNGDWTATAQAEDWEKKAAAVLADEFGSARLVVVKDPRICRMMPFWKRVFDRAGYGVRIILPLRSPLEVARSLRQRDGFPLTKGLLLWLRHVLDADAASRDLPRAVLHVPDLLADWQLATARVGDQIGLAWPRRSDRCAAEIDAFLSPEPAPSRRRERGSVRFIPT